MKLKWINTYGISFMNSDTLLYLLQNVDGRSDILHITTARIIKYFCEWFDRERETGS